MAAQATTNFTGSNGLANQPTSYVVADGFVGPGTTFNPNSPTFTGASFPNGIIGSPAITGGAISATTLAASGAATLSSTLTVTGLTTLNGNVIFKPNTPVAATGSALSSAAQLLNGFTVVTASDGTKCVKLPAVPTPGMMCVLFNSVSGQPLIIFPDAAATINAVGSHGALTCANTVPVILYATSATQWYSIPLLPS